MSNGLLSQFTMVVPGVARRLCLRRRMGRGISPVSGFVSKSSSIGTNKLSSIRNQFGCCWSNAWIEVRSITEGINVLVRYVADDFSRSLAPFLHVLKSIINKPQLELRCFYWLFSFAPFLNLKAARHPILITTQSKCLYMLLHNIINCDIRYHRRRILETCTTDRTTLVFL